MQVESQPGFVSGFSVSRTAEGFPKLSKEETTRHWSRLNIKDKEYLKKKYSLDLETK